MVKVGGRHQFDRMEALLKDTWNVFVGTAHKNKMEIKNVAC
jgi:hypothetical protein